MKRVTFYYVRHGRTEFNRDGIIQGGRVDAPLVRESIPAIEATGRALAPIPLSRCYSSPLGRAVETARIVTSGRGLEVEPLDDLREFDFGDLDGKPYAGNRLKFAHCFVRQDFSPYGGEAGEQVRGRVRSAFGRMFDQAADGDNVLVVCHGAFFRYVLLEYYPVSHLRRKLMSETIKTPNAGIAVIVGESNNFTLTELPVTAERFAERHPSR